MRPISGYSNDVERRCPGFGSASTTHNHTRAVLDLGCWELDPAEFSSQSRPLLFWSARQSAQQSAKESAGKSAGKSAALIKDAIEQASNVAAGIVIKHRAGLHLDMERANAVSIQLEEALSQADDEW